MSKPYALIQRDMAGNTESRMVHTAVMLMDEFVSQPKYAYIEELEKFSHDLVNGLAIPVGSVEYVRDAAAIAGANIEFDTYPECLNDMYGREIDLIQRKNLHYYPKPIFVKPYVTKQFPGFVYTEIEEAPEEFLSCHGEDLIYVSEVVEWAAEARLYFVGGRLVGLARYDEKEDDELLPDYEFSCEVVDRLVDHFDDTGRPFSVDIGVLTNGETAVIEFNDFWALGYYTCDMTPKEYFTGIYKRWIRGLQ